MRDTVLPWGGAVFFFEQPVKIAGIIIANPGDDFLHGHAGGSQKMHGVDQPFPLQIGGESIGGIFFHQPADEVGRLAGHS